MTRTRRALGALVAGPALGVILSAAPARAVTTDPSPVPGATPATPEPSSGVMIGASVGYLAGTPQTLTVSTTPGPYIGLNAGFRLLQRLYLGGVYQHGFIGGVPSDPGGPANYVGPVSHSADTDYVGVNFGFISNPAGIGFFGEIGGGYRLIHQSWQAEQSTPVQSVTYEGAEVVLGIGLHAKFGDWVRVVPEASLSVTGAGGPITPGSIFALVGVTAYLDLSGKL